MDSSEFKEFDQEMNEGNLLISIVVPVYKVELYLARCVVSLLNQTYQNIEIILVDDGSPDRCGEICDEYANKDSRIVVLHKNNGGLSDARNKGLDIATGDYVMFVDSDDWIEKDTCETVASIVGSLDVDIVSFGIQLVDDNKIIEIQKIEAAKIITSKQAVFAMIYKQKQQGLLNYVCNKAFRKELFCDIRFPVGLLFEDQDVTYKLMHKAKAIYVCDKVFYNYYQRDGSIMSGFYAPKALHDRIEIWIKRYDFMCEYYPEYANYQLAQVLGDIFIALIKLKGSTEYREFRNRIKAFADNHKSVEGRLTKYNNKVKLHYFCNPLFELYVKWFIK